MLICCWFVHVGPATQEVDVLERMMQAGMSVVRMNFSHGSYEVSIPAVSFDWRRGVVVSGVRRINEVNARRARIVLKWVTVFGRVYHLAM